jgi:hypothetical protein
VSFTRSNKLELYSKEKARAVLLKTAAEHIGSNKNDNSYGNGHYLAI